MLKKKKIRKNVDRYSRDEIVIIEPTRKAIKK